MMLIWGLSSWKIKQQHTHTQKRSKQGTKKVLEHKHKNTNKNGEADERNERKKLR